MVQSVSSCLKEGNAAVVCLGNGTSHVQLYTSTMSGDPSSSAFLLSNLNRHSTGETKTPVIYRVLCFVTLNTP